MRHPRQPAKAGVSESADHHDDDSITIPSASDVPAALRRRGAASWPERHRSRLDRIFGVRWLDQQSDDWTDHELDSWGAAAEHLCQLDLYSPEQIPGSVIAAWRRRRSWTSGRDEAA